MAATQERHGLISRVTDDRRGHYVLPVLAVVCVGVLYFLKENLEETTWLICAFCGGSLVLVFLFTRLEWYYYAMLMLIPLSMDYLLPFGGKLNFPSEGLLTLLVPVVLLFNPDFRQVAKRTFSHPLAILLLADVLFLLFISLFSTHLDVSLKRVFMRGLFLVGFFLMIQLFEHPRRLILPWILYAIGLVPVMFSTLRNHIRYDFDPRVVFNICEPYYPDHTVYGACLACILPFLLIVLLSPQVFQLKKYQNVLLWVLFLVVVVSVILALSRAALLSLGVAAFFALLLRYRMRFGHLVAVIVLAGAGVWAMSGSIYESIRENESVSNDGELVNHFSSVTNIKSDASNLERINRWVCAWRMFEDRPFTGYGPGTYQFEYNRFQTLVNKTYISTNMGDRGNAHSEYMTYLSETGIVGFLIWLAIVFGSIYLGMRNHYGTADPVLLRLNMAALLGLVTYYFHGLFNSFIDQSKMAFLVYSALGILVWVHLRIRKSSTA